MFSANDRCDQENLIAQLKGGVHALKTPVDDLVSNWAYMVMASLAWSLKAWSALMLPVSPRHAAKHTAEKRTLIADGVRDVLCGGDPDAVPDPQEREAVDLSVVVVESMAGDVPAAGGAVARLLVVLSEVTPEVGVRMPRSVLAIERREAVRGCSRRLATRRPGITDRAQQVCAIA